MGQMTITAYTDENFSSEYKSALELPINPDKVKFTKGIEYAEDKQLGSLTGRTYMHVTVRRTFTLSACSI